MEFAPVNTTGNFRNLKFIKYLGDFGIRPIIATFLAEDAALFFNAKIDTNLLNELPPDTIIYRIPCKHEKKSRFPKLHNFLRIYFSIQDDLAKRWKPFLMAEIGSIIKKHQPKIVYTSLPPFSSGLLAAEVSEKYSIPLVTDMRDLWSHFGGGPSPSYWHYKLSLKEEEKLYKKSSAVIYVTPQMRKTLQKIHPEANKKKYHYISNGFDINIENIIDFKFSITNEKIIIGYVGAFYYHPERRNSAFKPRWKKRGHKMLEYNHVQDDWLYRSPYFFLKTISHLKKNKPLIGNRIQIEFVGIKPDWLEDMVEEFDLKDNIISHGFVCYDESKKLQNGFDLFLATSEKIINEEHYCLPSKIFDFVGMNKPILGFVTEGIQKEFIEKSGLGIICNPDDIEGSANVLIELITKGREFQPEITYLKNFYRPALAQNLATLLNSIN